MQPACSQSAAACQITIPNPKSQKPKFQPSPTQQTVQYIHRTYSTLYYSTHRSTANMTSTIHYHQPSPSYTTHTAYRIPESISGHNYIPVCKLRVLTRTVPSSRIPSIDMKAIYMAPTTLHTHTHTHTPHTHRTLHTAHCTLHTAHRAHPLWTPTVDTFTHY